MEGSVEGPSIRTSLVEVRRRLAQNLEIHPRALSSDGHAFRFLPPVASELQIGGYVRFESPASVA
jgi:hypothetical protein